MKRLVGCAIVVGFVWLTALTYFCLLNKDNLECHEIEDGLWNLPSNRRLSDFIKDNSARIANIESEVRSCASGLLVCIESYDNIREVVEYNNNKIDTMDTRISTQYDLLESMYLYLDATQKQKGE